MSDKARLSQNTAIMLERARRFGVKDADILTAQAAGDINVFKPAVAEHYEYDDFFTYATEHGEPLDVAIREGYRMTFNTNNGLKLWLKERFGVEAGRDFESIDGRIIGLTLPATDVESLQQIVAANWVVQMIAESDSGEAGKSGNGEDRKHTVNITIHALLQA